MWEGYTTAHTPRVACCGLDSTMIITVPQLFLREGEQPGNARLRRRCVHVAAFLPWSFLPGGKAHFALQDCIYTASPSPDAHIFGNDSFPRIGRVLTPDPGVVQSGNGSKTCKTGTRLNKMTPAAHTELVRSLPTCGTAPSKKLRHDDGQVVMPWLRVLSSVISSTMCASRPRRRPW